MAFTLQMVVTTGTGRTVGILETRRFNATTLVDAKRYGRHRGVG